MQEPLSKHQQHRINTIERFREQCNELALMQLVYKHKTASRYLNDEERAAFERYSQEQERIKKERGALSKQNREDSKITVFCAGGCGRSVSLRRAVIAPMDYYTCNSRECGRECEHKLPPKPAGMVREMTFNAAAHFSGFRDVTPDADTLASIQRAQEIHAAGIVKLAIEKAQKQC